MRLANKILPREQSTDLQQRMVIDAYFVDERSVPRGVGREHNAGVQKDVKNRLRKHRPSPWMKRIDQPH